MQKNLTQSKIFLHQPRITEKSRAIHERVKDFHHVYEKPLTDITKVQAQRCMGCGVPFCHGDHGCPLHNNIPDWNELFGQGQVQEALDSLHATNNFPEFTGQLCPAPCEAACVLSLATSPVTIRQIELSIITTGFEQNLIKPHLAPSKKHKSVGIVGSGPAGLAAAQELARRGFGVTVYEKSDRIGGLLRYGIPDFKMEKWMIDRRLDQLRAEGITFEVNCEIGHHMSLDQMFNKHQAVGLSLGAEQPRTLQVPGHELLGVIPAMTYLTVQNRQNAGDFEHLTYDAKDRHVVILGGGDTGSDCLGTALRQGAKSVRQFELLPCPPRERSSTTPWPLWPLQLRNSHAHDEGGERLFSTATTGFLGENGHVTHIRTIGLQHDGGIFTPVPDTEAVTPVDLVILATGYIGVPPSVKDKFPGVTFNSKGLIETNSQYMTKRKGVFAAGDARRGASLIVWAIAEGRKMADGIEQYLAL